ncbi:MAG: hypothetical protein ACK5DG_01520 [Chitinophagaceae bacterium]|jgi:hypothetical protein
MKLFLLPFFLLCSITLNAQQWEFAFGLSNQTPRGSMADNISSANGGNFHFGYRLPVVKNKFVVSVDFGSGRFGKKRIEQTFQNDVVQTPTNFMVNYINYANFSHLNLRYEILSKGYVIPYVHFIGGRQTLGTRVRINVHEDQVGGDECVPLEDEVTFRKRSMVWGYGGGLIIGLVNPENSKTFRSGIMLNLSVSHIRGGNMDYVNVKQLEQVSTRPQPNDGSKEWAVPFTNLNTNNIHNHTIARVYNSPLEQLQFRIGLIFKFDE